MMMYQTLYQNLVMFKDMFRELMLFKVFLMKVLYKVFLMEVLFKVPSQRLLFQDPGGQSNLTLSTAQMSMTWTKRSRKSVKRAQMWLLNFELGEPRVMPSELYFWPKPKF
jgi:hypothetical protein